MAVSPLSPPSSVIAPSVKGPILMVSPENCALPLDTDDEISRCREVALAQSCCGSSTCVSVEACRGLGWWLGACVGCWGGAAGCCSFPWEAATSASVEVVWGLTEGLGLLGAAAADGAGTAGCQGTW